MSRLNFDIYTKIIKNVNSINDLVNICALNKDNRYYCKNYKKTIFLNLIKNKNFRRSFYKKFDDLIKIDRHSNVTFNSNWFNVMKLLQYYPIGEINTFNSVQLDFINIFENRTNKNNIYAIDFILHYQYILQYYFKLLFYPSNYITNILTDAEILYELNKVIPNSDQIDIFKPIKNRMMDVYLFHLQHVDYETIHNLLVNLMINVIHEEESVEFTTFMLNFICLLQSKFNLSTDYLKDVWHEALPIDIEFNEDLFNC
jgi:hypothetical protein